MLVLICGCSLFPSTTQNKYKQKQKEKKNKTKKTNNKEQKKCVAPGGWL